MLTLLEIQNLFAASLLTGEVSKELAQQVRSGKNLDGSARVLLYRKHSREGHLKSLRSTYPAIEKLIEPHNFKMLSVEYWKRYGANSPSLHDYGSELSTLLKELIVTVPQLQQFPFLPDLAVLEWNLWKIYTTDSQSCVIDVDYPVDQLRRDLLSKSEPSVVEKSPLTLTISKRDTTFIIERIAN